MSLFHRFAKLVVIGTVGFQGVAAQAQIITGEEWGRPTGADYGREYTLFITEDSNKLRLILNLISNAAGYGYWVNYIRNGSGNKEINGDVTEVQSPTRQGLRSLSLFDMYFTKGMEDLEKEIGAGNLNYLITPVTTKSYLNADLKFSKGILGSALSKIAPLFQPLVKNFPMDYRNNQTFINDVIEGMKQQLSGSYPMASPVLPAERLMWLGTSYEPVLAESTMTIDAVHGSQSRMRMILPAIGELVPPKTDDNRMSTNIEDYRIQPFSQDLGKGQEIDTPQAIFNHFGYNELIRTDEKSYKVIQVESQKDFSKANSNKLTLITTFGRLNSKAKSMDNLVDSSNPYDGITVSGHAKFPESSWTTLIGKIPGLKNRVNQIKLEIVFQKVQMILERKNGESWQEAFAKDESGSLTYDPKNSDISLRIGTPRFLASSNDCDSENCYTTIQSKGDSKATLINQAFHAIENLLLMNGIKTQVATAFNSQMSNSLDLVDAEIPKILQKLMSEPQTMKQKVSTLRSSINFKNLLGTEKK